MRRNNNVFLVGNVVHYVEREVTVEKGKKVPLIDLLLQTEKPEISREHKVVVRGRQAEELHHFLQAAQPELPDVMVLGWLHSGQESIVMAERVTVLVCREVRQAAVEAIKQSRSKR